MVKLHAQVEIRTYWQRPAKNAIEDAGRLRFEDYVQMIANKYEQAINMNLEIMEAINGMKAFEAGLVAEIHPPPVEDLRARDLSNAMQVSVDRANAYLADVRENLKSLEGKEFSEQQKKEIWGKMKEDENNIGDKSTTSTQTTKGEPL